MFRILWNLSVMTRLYLRRYMPTNIVLDLIRTRRGLKWGLPAVLLTPAYLYLASVVTVLIRDGAPQWLHLLALLFIWNALKFLMIGPYSLMLLARVRVQESRNSAHHTRLTPAYS